MTAVLSLLVARTDVQWIEQMVAHISRTHRQQVDGICIFVDTAPLGPAYVNRLGVGTMDQLRSIMNGLRTSGVIDEVRDLRYEKSVRKNLYRKYFGKDLGATHNFRGYPVLGSIDSIDSVDADYVIHLDSDMLVHASPNSNWIADAIDLIESDQDVMFAAPRSGPPRDDGVLIQDEVSYEVKERYYGFKQFTSRKYLFSPQKLKEILPIKPQYISWKRRFLQQITGRSALWNWEIMVSRALEGSRLLRADLTATDSWTLHTPDHGSEFVRHLPDIISKVENGWFPPEQAGDYDLKLEYWIS